MNYIDDLMECLEDEYDQPIEAIPVGMRSDGCIATILICEPGDHPGLGLYNVNVAYDYRFDGDVRYSDPIPVSPYDEDLYLDEAHEAAKRILVSLRRDFSGPYPYGTPTFHHLSGNARHGWLANLRRH